MGRDEELVGLLTGINKQNFKSVKSVVLIVLLRIKAATVTVCRHHSSRKTTNQPFNHLTIP